MYIIGQGFVILNSYQFKSKVVPKASWAPERPPLRGPARKQRGPVSWRFWKEKLPRLFPSRPTTKQKKTNLTKRRGKKRTGAILKCFWYNVIFRGAHTFMRAGADHGRQAKEGLPEGSRSVARLNHVLSGSFLILIVRQSEDSNIGRQSLQCRCCDCRAAYRAPGGL